MNLEKLQDTYTHTHTQLFWICIEKITDCVRRLQWEKVLKMKTRIVPATKGFPIIAGKVSIPKVNQSNDKMSDVKQ